MSKTATVKARIEPELKEQAEAILQRIGLNTTQAITLFYQQIVLYNGLPFGLRIPNEETLEALAEAHSGIGLTSVSLEDMLKDLEEDEDAERTRNIEVQEGLQAHKKTA